MQQQAIQISGVTRNSRVPRQSSIISNYFSSGARAEPYNFKLFFFRCPGMPTPGYATNSDEVMEMFDRFVSISTRTDDRLIVCWNTFLYINVLSVHLKAIFSISLFHLNESNGRIMNQCAL